MIAQQRLYSVDTKPGNDKLDYNKSILLANHKRYSQELPLYEVKSIFERYYG